MKSGIFFLLIAILGLASCRYETLEEIAPRPDCPLPETISYSIDIQPIIEANCSIDGCHDAVEEASGLNFTTFDDLGQAVNNGDFEREVVIERTMPDDSFPPLTDCEIKKIQAWLEAGAPNN